MTSPLADSHCHLDQIPGGAAVAAQALAAARQAGVTRFLTVGIAPTQWPAMLAIAAAEPDVWAAVGLHPNDSAPDGFDAGQLRAAAAHPKVVAIGETGLDGYRGPDELVAQSERFALHLQVARELGRPVIVHSRMAARPTLDLLRSEAARGVTGVLHCYTDDWETARGCLDLGYCISLSGIVTFRNADTLREVARRLPLDRLLVETDAPYLAPVPHRGKPNQPAWVVEVAACIARERGIALAELAAATTANFCRLFGLPPTH